MKRIISALTILAMLIGMSTQVSATPHYEEGVLYEIECTAYCDSEQLTATQTRTREGIAAFSPEYYGYVAVVTMPDGENRCYEIQDIGSDPIRNGQVLDIWMESEEECIAFGRQKLRVYFVKGRG